MKFLAIATAALFIAPVCHAGLLGDFSQTTESVGYLTSDTDSPLFKGVGHNPRLSYYIELRTPSKILKEDFLDKTGTVKVESVTEKVLEIQRAKRTAFAIFCLSEIKKTDTTTAQDCRNQTANVPDRIFKKWKTKKQHAIYDFILAKLEAARAEAMNLPALRGEGDLGTTRYQPFLNNLFEGLAVYDSIRSEDARISNLIKNSVAGIRGYLSAIHIEEKKRPEATNLQVPGKTIVPDATFLSGESLKSRGYDISKLDPVPSGFWRPPVRPVGKADLTNYSGDVNLAGASDLLDSKKELTLDYESPKGGGTTPKFEVRWNGGLYKLKFSTTLLRPAQAGSPVKTISNLLADKLEVQTESIANNLAHALGYTVDPTFYKRRVRVYFPKDGYKTEDIGTENGANRHDVDFERERQDLIAELEARMEDLEGRGVYDYRGSLGLDLVRTDKNGRKYLELNSVSLEGKDDLNTDFEVGFFAKDRFGRAFKREFRAFLIFSALMIDDDNKDGNSDMKLVRTVDPKGNAIYKTGYSASDMGSVLGRLFAKNKPNLFSYDLINPEKGVERNKDGSLKRVTLTYRSPYYNSIYDAITPADVRWITRRLAQLRPAQIEAAFLSVDYHPLVAKIFTQKILRRIDQLVRAFDLEGTVAKADASGEEVILKTKSEITDPKKYFVADYQDYFEDGELVKAPKDLDVRWLLSYKKFPEGSLQQEALKSLIAQGIAVGAKTLGKAVQRFSVSEGVFVDAVKVGLNGFLPARYLLANPTENTRTPYWVVDVYRIGFAAGVGRQLTNEFGMEFDDNDAQVLSGITRTYEFIRVHPVSSPGLALEQIAEIFKPTNFIGLPFKGIRDDMLKSMTPGDVFVSSIYTIMGADGNVDAPIWGPLGAYVTVGSYGMALKRQLVMREDTGDYLSQWLNKKALIARGQAGFKLLFLRFPALKMRFEKSKTVEDLFRFSDKSPQQLSELQSSLASLVPKESETTGVRMGRREVDEKSSGWFLSLFKLFSAKREKSVTLVTLEDPETAKPRHYMLASLDKDKEANPTLIAKKNQTFSANVIRDLDGSVHARVQLHYRKQGAHPKHFLESVEKFLPVDRKKLLTFEAEDLNHYMGTYSLDADVYFSSEALEDVFSPAVDREQLCHTYIATAQADMGSLKPSELCALMFDNVDIRHWIERRNLKGSEPSTALKLITGFRSFVGRFEKAKKLYINRPKTLDTAKDAHKMKDAMNAIAEALDNGSTQRIVLTLLQGRTSLDKIYRRVSIKSNMSFLPGQFGSVDLPVTEQGGMDENVLNVFEKGLPDFAIVDMRDALEDYFFDSAFLHSRRSFIGFRFPTKTAEE